MGYQSIIKDKKCSLETRNICKIRSLTIKDIKVPNSHIELVEDESRDGRCKYTVDRGRDTVERGCDDT